MASYELAAKLQLSAPQVLDLSDETAATLAAYGVNDQPLDPPRFGHPYLDSSRRA